MTDSRDVLDAIERAVAELLPELSRRLERHGLGEIEVRHGDLRMRIAGVRTPEAPTSPAPLPTMRAAGGRPSPADAPGTPSTPAVTTGVTSPAVGFFVYADGLGPGLSVQKGDGLGYVEMLGVRHDVVAPRSGTVRHLVAESGEAVEYGQIVVDLEPADVQR